MTRLPALLKLQYCFCGHLTLELKNHIFALMSVSLEIYLFCMIFLEAVSCLFSAKADFFYNAPLLHQYLLKTAGCYIL